MCEHICSHCDLLMCLCELCLKPYSNFSLVRGLAYTVIRNKSPYSEYAFIFYCIPWTCATAEVAYIETVFTLIVF